MVEVVMMGLLEKALDNAFDRICDHIGPLFKGDLYWTEWRELYFLEERYRFFLFGFIPIRVTKYLICVNLKKLEEENAVHCTVYNPSILEVVKEEMTRYAEEIGANKVVIDERFSEQ